MSAWADRSEQIDLIAPALVAALGKLTDVPKNRTANTGSYRYTYADLGDVLDMARPILSENGLAVMQVAEADNAFAAVTTTIIHVSGQFMTSAPLRLPVGNTPQQAGSAVTYARRYSLMAVLGVAGDDDDGQAAAAPSRQTAQRAPRPPAPPAEPRTDDEAEARRLLATVDQPTAAAIRREFQDKFGMTLSALPPERHQDALYFIATAINRGDDDGQEDAS